MIHRNDASRWYMIFLSIKIHFHSSPTIFKFLAEGHLSREPFNTVVVVNNFAACPSDIESTIYQLATSRTTCNRSWQIRIPYLWVRSMDACVRSDFHVRLARNKMNLFDQLECNRAICRAPFILRTFPLVPHRGAWFFYPSATRFLKAHLHLCVESSSCLSEAPFMYEDDKKKELLGYDSFNLLLY